jgi:PH and SEC7 domain-containing protein
MTLRLKKRGEKALERALVVSSPEEDSSNTSKWKGYPEEDTIPEGEEPPSGISPSPQLRRDGG